MSAQTNILSFEDITLRSNGSRRAEAHKRTSARSQRAAHTHTSLQSAHKSTARASSSSHESLQKSQRSASQSKRNTRSTRQRVQFDAQSGARGKTRQSHRLAVTSNEHTADAISPRLSVRSRQNRSLQGFASGGVHDADRVSANGVGARARSASASSHGAYGRRFQQADSTAALRQASRRHSDDTHKDKKAKTSFAQKFKKNSRKAKAEKKFNKSPYAQSASREQTSRAALYEMRMGRTQKKSSRMHDEQTRSNSSSRSSFSALGMLGAFSRVFSSRVALAFVALAFTFAFLYQPLSSYYGETRHLQRLEVEYAALTEHNNALQSEIDYLNTDEGLEDYARYKLGLVKSNEHIVNVTNVSSSDKENESDDLIYAIPSGNVQTPDTWYSGVLDVVFNYQK